MAVSYNSSIVSNGLILCIDPKNPRSYSGSGTAMYDASNFQYNGAASTNTISGAPTYSSGYLTFNGSTQYINSYRTDINGGSWAYSNVTVCAWVNMDNTAGAGVENNIGTVENAWEFRWVNNGNGTSTLAFASNPWAWIGSGTVTNGVWQMITFRHGATTGDFFSNATLLSATAISGGITAGTASYPMLTLMARVGGAGSFAKGSMGLVTIYNRAITDAEITQNFNATRGRYGI